MARYYFTGPSCFDGPPDSGILSGFSRPITLNPSAENFNTILVRRHKAAVTTVAGLVIAIILLSIVAFLGKGYFRQQAFSRLDLVVRAAVLVLGLSSIIWRRRSLSVNTMRAIGTTNGPEGLLGLLERTSLQIAVIGAAIALVGFVSTLVTGNDMYTYWAGVIAIVVLLFHYPRLAFWTKVVDEFTPSGEKSPQISNMAV